MLAQRVGSIRGAAGLALAAALALIPLETASAGIKSRGNAVVRSVDGAAELTLTTKSGSLKVRLASIDTPRPGECGYDGAVASLRGFVRRAPKRLRYGLVRLNSGAYLRYADGRYGAALSYRGRSRSATRDLSTDLINAEWARYGEPQELGGPPAPETNVEGFSFGGGEIPEPVRQARGLWAACGGRTHLPASAAVPVSVPAPWTVSAQGVTTAIGPITLSPTLAPGATLTFADLAALTPIEVLSIGWAPCYAALPALQIAAIASRRRGSCQETEVEVIWTTGPGATTTTLGPKIGDPAASLAAAFPAVARHNDDHFRSLGGIPHTWAWQTFASLEDGRISDFITYVAVPQN